MYQSVLDNHRGCEFSSIQDANGLWCKIHSRLLLLCASPSKANTQANGFWERSVALPILRGNTNDAWRQSPIAYEELHNLCVGGLEASAFTVLEPLPTGFSDTTFSLLLGSRTAEARIVSLACNHSTSEEIQTPFVEDLTYEERSAEGLASIHAHAKQVIEHWIRHNLGLLVNAERGGYHEISRWLSLKDERRQHERDDFCLSGSREEDSKLCGFFVRSEGCIVGYYTNFRKVEDLKGMRNQVEEFWGVSTG